MMSALEPEVFHKCEEIAASVLTNYGDAKLISPTEIWTSEDRERLARAYFEIAKLKSLIKTLGKER